MRSFIKSHRRGLSDQQQPSSPTKPPQTDSVLEANNSRTTTSLDLPQPSTYHDFSDQGYVGLKKVSSLSPSKPRNPPLSTSSSSSKLGRFFQLGKQTSINSPTSKSSSVVTSFDLGRPPPLSPTLPNKSSSFGSTTSSPSRPSIIGTRVHEWGAKSGQNLVMEVRNLKEKDRSEEKAREEQDNLYKDVSSDDDDDDDDDYGNISTTTINNEEFLQLPLNTILEISQAAEEEEISSPTAKQRKIKMKHRRAQIITKTVSFINLSSSDSDEEEEDQETSRVDSHFSYESPKNQGLLPPIELTQSLKANNFSFDEEEESLLLNQDTLDSSEQCQADNSSAVTPPYWNQKEGEYEQEQHEETMNLSEKLEKFLHIKQTPKTPQTPTTPGHRYLYSSQSAKSQDENEEEYITTPTKPKRLKQQPPPPEFQSNDTYNEDITTVDDKNEYENESEFSFEQDNIGRNSSRRFYKPSAEDDEDGESVNNKETIRQPGFYINDHYEDEDFDDDMNYFDEDDMDDFGDDEEIFNMKYFSDSEEEKEIPEIDAQKPDNNNERLNFYGHPNSGTSNLLTKKLLSPFHKNSADSTPVSPMPQLILPKRTIKYHQLSHQLDHDEISFEKYRCISDDFGEKLTDYEGNGYDNFIEDDDDFDDSLLDEINGVPEDYDDYEQHIYAHQNTLQQYSKLNSNNRVSYSSPLRQTTLASNLTLTPNQIMSIPSSTNQQFHNSPYKHHKHTQRAKTLHSMNSSNHAKHFITDYSRQRSGSGSDKFETGERVVTLFHSKSTSGRINQSSSNSMSPSGDGSDMESRSVSDSSVRNNLLTFSYLKEEEEGNVFEDNGKQTGILTLKPPPSCSSASLPTEEYNENEKLCSLFDRTSIDSNSISDRNYSNSSSFPTTPIQPSIPSFDDNRTWIMTPNPGFLNSRVDLSPISEANSSFDE